MLDLFLEQGDDRTVRPQHITETCGHELSDALHLSVFDGFIQTLHINLTDTLGTSHNIGRVHRFVRRHHDKLLHAVFDRQVCNDSRAIDIVTDALSRIVFHHRYMLVGSCMEYIVRSAFCKDFLHPFLHANISDDSLRFYIRPLFRHYQPDVMQGSFRLVYQYQFLRIELRHLPHDFAADASRGSRDENDFIRQQLFYRIQIDFYFLARQ